MLQVEIAGMLAQTRLLAEQSGTWSHQAGLLARNATEALREVERLQQARAVLLELVREMEEALGWYTSFQNDVRNTTPEYFELCGDLNATMYLASEAESIRARAAALIRKMSDDPTDHIPVAACVANNI